MRGEHRSTPLQSTPPITDLNMVSGAVSGDLSNTPELGSTRQIVAIHITGCRREIDHHAEGGGNGEVPRMTMRAACSFPVEHVGAWSNEAPGKCDAAGTSDIPGTPMAGRPESAMSV